jgi:hypothetical protein
MIGAPGRARTCGPELRSRAKAPVTTWRAAEARILVGGNQSIYLVVLLLVDKLSYKPTGFLELRICR